MKEKQSKKPLAHEQRGFNPSAPKKPADKIQVGPLPTDDPHHNSQAEIRDDRSKSSKHRSE